MVCFYTPGFFPVTEANTLSATCLCSSPWSCSSASREGTTPPASTHNHTAVTVPDSGSTHGCVPVTTLPVANLQYSSAPCSLDIIETYSLMSVTFSCWNYLCTAQSFSFLCCCCFLHVNWTKDPLLARYATLKPCVEIWWPMYESVLSGGNPVFCCWFFLFLFCSWYYVVFFLMSFLSWLRSGMSNLGSGNLLWHMHFVLDYVKFFFFYLFFFFRFGFHQLQTW